MEKMVAISNEEYCILKEEVKNNCLFIESNFKNEYTNSSYRIIKTSEYYDLESKYKIIEISNRNNNNFYNLAFISENLFKYLPFKHSSKNN